MGLDEKEKQGDADERASDDSYVYGATEFALAEAPFWTLAFSLVVGFGDFDARGLVFGFGYGSVRFGLRLGARRRGLSGWFLFRGWLLV